MKKLQSIETFNKGVIGSIDPTDIPDEAASWSIDVDGETVPGKLLGRYDDTTFQAAGPANIAGVQSSAFLTNPDGTQDLVYYDNTANKIRSVTDFYGSIGSVTDQYTLSTQKNACVTSFNAVARVGLGKTSAIDEPTKWVGQIKYVQFNGTIPPGIQCVNSELSAPQILPTLYKSFSDGTYVYGITFKGTKLFKIAIAGGAITVSTISFVSTQGICKISGSYCYLFDKNGAFGILYKIKLSDLTINATYPLSGFTAVGQGLATCGGICLDTLITDIEISASYIWFISSSATGFQVMTSNATVDAAFIYNYLIASLADGTSFYPDDRSPMTFNSGANGAFSAAVGAASYILPQTPFIGTVESGKIAVLVNVAGNCWYDWGGSRDTTMGWGVILLSETMTAGNYLNDTSTLYFYLEVPTTGYTGGVKLSGVGSNTIYQIFGQGTDDCRGYIAVAGGASDWTSAHKGWSGVGAQTATADTTQSKSGIGNLQNIFSSYISDDGSSEYLLASTSATTGIGGLLTYKLSTSAVRSSETAVSYSPCTVSVISFASLGNFDITKQYFYLVVFQYDNFQSSPFSLYASPATIHVGLATNSIQVRVDLTASLVPLRVNAIQIFRAEASTLGESVPDSFYRYVDSIDITKSMSLVTDSFWGNRYYGFIVDTGNYGESYQQMTGIAETVDSTTLRYEIAATYQGYLFAGRCYHPELPDATRMIFRSKQQCMDQFDWTNDYVILPKMPVGMAVWMGKLFVFTDAEMYIINPANLTLEGIQNGVGLLNQQSLCVTPYGMFWGDINNMYMHDGQSVKLIGYPMLYSVNPNGSGYRSYIYPGSLYTLSVGSFLKLGYILFIVSKIGITYDNEIFAFHVIDQRWDYWNIGLSYSSNYQPSVITGKYGEAYFGSGAGLIQICGTQLSTLARRQFSWYSKNFSYGEPEIRKRLFKSNTVSSGGALTANKYSTDDGTSFTSLTNDTQLSPVVFFKKVMLYLEGSATGTGETRINSIGILSRIMEPTNANT